MEEMRIRKITLVKERTETDSRTVVAIIKKNGDLMLEGYDIGEAPKKFWGDSDYEYWRTVKKEYKDTILQWLIKERFDTDPAFKDWLDEKGIPRKRSRGDSDYEYWQTVKEKYKDTILLWLIKERFDSESAFSDWLGEKGIPSEFMSWI